MTFLNKKPTLEQGEVGWPKETSQAERDLDDPHKITNR